MRLVRCESRRRCDDVSISGLASSSALAYTPGPCAAASRSRLTDRQARA